MAEYTESGGEGKPAFDQEEAVRTMMEYYEAVVPMFEDLITAGSLNYVHLRRNLSSCRLQPTISCPVPDVRDQFVNKVTGLLKAFAISVPHEDAMAIRDEVAFFQSVKARIVKDN